MYALFACGQLLGVWERIEAALIAAADAAGKLSWQVSVDSTTSRAHVHAAGARRDSVDGRVRRRSHGRGVASGAYTAVDAEEGIDHFLRVSIR